MGRWSPDSYTGPSSKPRIYPSPPHPCLALSLLDTEGCHFPRKRSAWKPWSSSGSMFRPGNSPWGESSPAAVFLSSAHSEKVALKEGRNQCKHIGRSRLPDRENATWRISPLSASIYPSPKGQNPSPQITCLSHLSQEQSSKVMGKGFREI